MLIHNVFLYQLKRLNHNLWENVAGEIKAGDIREGVVKRLVTFGAFVEILPGVEGLVHVSQIANRHVKIRMKYWKWDKK